MKPTALKLKLMVAAASLVLPGFAATDDDGPGRGVARISVINGDVSVRRGDSGDWLAAAINAPLVVQDRVFCGPASRAEVQFDYSNMLRVGENSEVRLAELEHQRYIVQVARGTVTFRVLRDKQGDVELSTPNVSVRPVKRGIYRLTVREDGSSEITVRSGEAEIFTPRGSERLSSGRTMQARGSASDPEVQIVAAVREDDWDRWNERRDHDLERTRSYQYVSSDIYGAEDLDGYGAWENVPPYGWVWSPRVAAGWAPYRYGRWSWIDWYGWSWVSYDPWGWAPYHYGRWFYHTRGWCWYPGPTYGHHYWRPALVAFFGWGHGGGLGVGVGFGFGNVGWVPLAPYEPYYPWYGRRYYGGYRNSTYIDNSVHVVNNVNITNVYRNARVNNAVTSVTATDFGRGSTGRLVRVADGDIREARLVRGQVPVAPERESTRLAERDVRAGMVPRTSDNTRFYSRRQPAAVERVPFEEQRRGIENMTRRTAGESPARAAEAGGAVRAGGEQPVRGAAPRTASETDSTRGWRRTTEPARTETAPAREGRTAEVAPRGIEQNSGRTTDGAWRRLGQDRTDRTTVRLPEQQAPATATPADRGAMRGQSAERDNWRRLGAPGRTSETAPTPRAEPAPTRRDSPSGDNWRRLGAPGRTSEPAPTPRAEPAPTRRDSSGNESWRRFGGDSPSRVEQPRTQPENFNREMRAPVRTQPREEIRVSPPIVRERAMPRYEDRGGMRAPEVRSAPQRESGGDSGMRRSGGESAPQRSGGGEVRGGGGRRR